MGGGAVGLAISRALSAQPGTSTILLERHRTQGTETSSRNSEVIHAGLYYGADTLKTALCLKGKRLMYAYCQDKGVPHMNCGKWIVSQNEEQAERVNEVHKLARDILGKDDQGEWWAETRWISKDEAQTREPAVRAAAGALESTSTGIVDSHSLMVALLGDFEDNGGTVSFGSSVTGIEALGQNGSDGWRVHVRGRDGEEESITAEVLVNSAGLGAIDFHNIIVPEERRRQPFYAKGNYYSYSASQPKVKTLIYPAPVPGHGGLGTHLTLDMGGRIRFGPDVEWVEDPNDLAPNGRGLDQALKDIKSYLPSLDAASVALDYSGIRPKLSGSGSVTRGKGFNDFWIRKEEGYHGWVNLMGIESPGLTSSMAIGQYVHQLLYGSQPVQTGFSPANASSTPKDTGLHD